MSERWRDSIESALRLRGRSVEGATVAVQGVGAVGSALVDALLDAGAHVIATDAKRERLSRLPPAVARVAPHARPQRSSPDGSRNTSSAAGQ